MLSVASRCSRRWPLYRTGRLPCSHTTAQARSLLRPCAATTRDQATLVGLDHHLKAGDDIHGFTLKRTKHVPELQLTAFDLHHKETGAQYLHVARDDKNNVFSIGFKTNPPDGTGVAHILEHTTLCGSERYPVRDPFFKMLRRSLSNFMNAFTSSDHTSYPFATTNQQDFKNLLSVYLDATLHPLLRENDYTQEGWRIGPENPKTVLGSPDPKAEDQKLVFKGVVYNEMKGQMSDASYLYYIRFQEHIFPAIGNSGGDPQEMTSLSHQKLREFHAKNYHPTNARLFTYGDMPLAEQAFEISKQLHGFTRATVDTSIKRPLTIEDGPLDYVVKGPVDPMLDPSMQFKTSTSWVLGDTSDVVETFSLGVLSSLLLNGYGSPLYQALIESGLGPDFSPNTGFDSSGRVGVFSVGLNGVKGDDVPKVKIALQQKLQEVHAQGFDTGKVDGILHQLELSLRHKTAGFGMDLMQRVEAPWFNGVDPFTVLAWNDTVNAFKANYAAGGYLESLLQKHLLNDRTMTFTMEPSATYADDLKAVENSQLSDKISGFSKEAGSIEGAYENLTKKELELLDEQTKAPDQDLSSLPTLHVKDIPRQMERKKIRDSSLESASVQWREASTNGLTYFRAISPLEGLPKDLRMLIPLFTDAIMRLGTKDKTMEELEDLIKLKTGGVGVSYYSSPSPLDSRTAVEGFNFSGQALDGNINTVYELLRILVLETDFDGPEAENKILQLLQADSSGVLDAIASSGHSYARRYAEAAFTKQGLLTEQIGGLTQVQQTANLASRTPAEGLGDVLAKLKSIQAFALSKSSSFRAAITCGPEASGQNERALSQFLSTLPEPISMPADVQSPDDYTPLTFFPLPYQVSYVACSLPTVSYIDPAGAPLQILSQLLTHKHLHHEIREKGGAYGGGAYARGLSGLFGFYSYRDPNPQRTLETIRDAGRWARDKDWTDQDLNEAKLSTFQSVDAPQSVSDEGMTRFLSGISEDMEQKQREHLLDVGKKDVQEVAQKFLVDGMKHARTAVLGEQKAWVKPSDGWTVKNIELSRASETVGASDLSAGDLGKS